MEIAGQIKSSLMLSANPENARFLQGYFKTGPGQYGEGDRFIGVRVPEVRRVLKHYKNLTPDDVLPLLHSSVHEERLFALLALIRCFERADQALRQQIFTLYLDNTAWINNWDLVDCSAPQIVGGYLLQGARDRLYLLARSTNVWERRIAIMATFAFIRSGQYSDTLEISEILLADKEDLIHKATGWMLREVGKREVIAEEQFLRRHCRVMPRTMLRYAIERFPEQTRRMYLSGKQWK